MNAPHFRMADGADLVELADRVRGRLRDHKLGNDPTVVRYMVARVALVGVSGSHGTERAGEIAYKLADEFAGATVPR